MKKQLFTIALAAVSILAFSQSDIITTVAGIGTASFSGDGGQATSATLNAPYRTAFDASGNMYIADNINNRIRKVSTSGIITTVAGTGSNTFTGDGGPATAAGLYTPASMAFDASGNMFIVDEDHFCIRKVTTSGIITTVAGIGSSAGSSGDGGQATAAKLTRPYGIAIDASGNLYIADTQNSRVRKVNTSGIITTIVGNGTAGFSGDGGQATAAEINNPREVAIDAAGNLYIADTPNHRVRKVSASGIITTLAGNGTGGYSGDGGQATAAELSTPSGVTVSGGNIYIADETNNRIRMVNASGIISTVVGNGTAGFSGDNGQATAAELNGPVGISLDQAGNLFVADILNNRIRKVMMGCSFSLSITGLDSICAGSSTIITVSGANTYTWSANAGSATTNTISVSPSSNTTYTVTGETTPGCTNTVTVSVSIISGTGTQLITTVAGIGTASFSGDGGQATSATLNAPYRTAFDASGNMYIADNINNRIRKVSTSGIITTVAGTGSNTFTGDGGPATAAGLYTPASMAFDASGNMFIVDEDHFCIRKVTTSGIITTVAGIGSSAGSSGDGGQATAAKLTRPYGIAIDASGNLYIADTQNSRVRKVNTSGIITTIVGNGTAGFSGDGGQATAAEINNPREVAIDAAGNLYIADTPNHRVRKVSASGIITTLAGNGTGGYSGDGGQATAAELSTPSGVTVSGGNIYIADETNNRIRMVNASGIISTVVGNGTAGFSGDNGQATAAELNGPVGISLDQAGNLFVADILNNRIRKVSNQCSSSMGISKINNMTIEQFIIYPNPTSAILNIELKVQNEITPIQITNMLGQEVIQTTMQQGKASIDVSSLQQGVYFIKINQGTQKFIKQ